MESGEETRGRESRLIMHAISKISYVASAVFISTLALHASDWPQWRGVNRDGKAASPAISSLPKDVKPVWKLPVGPGFSAPVVANDKLVYLDEQNGKEVAHCLDANSGKPIWNTPFADSAGDEWGS